MNMINNMKFSTVNTKISAMKSNMLSEKDFITLMKLENVKEVFNYLNDNTAFNKVLWNLKGRKIHRNEVERALYKYRVIVIEKIMFYLRDEYKNFIKSYMLRYEIEDLKLVLEVVLGRTKPDNFQDYLFSSKYSKINFTELLEQDSINKVLEKLKGTDYYRLILPYSKQIDDKFSFYIEMILDKYYYHQLVATALKLPYQEDKESTEILRKNIDLLNLEWIYRATKYYDMSKEEILNFVLDYGYKYDYHKLKDFIYAFDLKKLKSYLEQTEYAFLFNHNYDDIDMYMERRIDRYTFYKALHLYRFSTLSFGKVIAYIQLIEFEVKDIISIIESKRYQMSAGEITKYLIRTIEVVE
ncbi:hypothetical protein GC105_02250 [Alkalibaculum sp. M08DMB]|uniref:ATPase n=1 Tax=Alkalibaculum sporogenes TaxID=2655001 RepID=A0A6A7K5J1_9FIRM|nr:V-type ATPase subunit [Alkalibaculum sporogenes]MPW24614.1 hypothetical protein [Alkalibaculum sporogenes]